MLLACTLLSPLTTSYALAAATPAEKTADQNIGIIKGNLWYGQYPFFSGETVSIYTAIWNGSDKKVRGKVAFLNNGVDVGRQSFTIEPTELQEVSVRWLATDGKHKFTAKIVEAYYVENGKTLPIKLEDSTTGESDVSVTADPNAPKKIEATPAIGAPGGVGSSASSVVVNGVPGGSASAGGSTSPTSIATTTSAKLEASITATDDFVGNLTDSLKGIVDGKKAILEKDLFGTEKQSPLAQEKKATTTTAMVGSAVGDEKTGEGVGSWLANSLAARKPFAYLAYYLLATLSFLLSYKATLYFLFVLLLILLFRKWRRRRPNRRYGY